MYAPSRHGGRVPSITWHEVGGSSSTGAKLSASTCLGSREDFCGGSMNVLMKWSNVFRIVDGSDNGFWWKGVVLVVDGDCLRVEGGVDLVLRVLLTATAEIWSDDGG